MEIPHTFKVKDVINGVGYKVEKSFDPDMKLVFLQLWVLEGEIMGQIHSEEDVELYLESKRWRIISEEEYEKRKH